MPFTEKIKLEAKKRSNFRCCICHKIFVEVHHILPEADGGSDTIDNAAPLCSSCHDLYGGNPEKRKQIRQMRDYWWDQMDEWRMNLSQKKDLDHIAIIEEEPENINQLKYKGIAIYHFIYKEEGFKESAQMPFDLVKEAQTNNPNQKRLLYLEIDGHRNKNGGFDHDMYELQRYFILEFLMPYLSSVSMPLLSVTNNKLQKNDFPDELRIDSED
ncbi:HNH endonuclease signature motif containing protein [Kineothrix sedimenti]|uniref:HNH endonuclease signature motif containing protein n=1 Tax=Kineothrix sedimenti TaxID=3123317 RepID=A0ABZ3EU19_9FIRM